MPAATLPLRHSWDMAPVDPWTGTPGVSVLELTGVLRDGEAGADPSVPLIGAAVRQRPGSPIHQITSILREA